MAREIRISRELCLSLRIDTHVIVFYLARLTDINCIDRRQCDEKRQG